jgi:putative holliday junction resolvase
VKTELAVLEHLPREGRLLGFDLGEKTIGLALSDVQRQIATPLETIRRKKFSADVVRISEIVKEHHIVGFVLGMPFNMDGSEGPRAQATRAFARNLATRLTIPIAFWDERMSTMAVERMLIDADTSRARRREVVDKLAAAYILQAAIDRLNSPELPS